MMRSRRGFASLLAVALLGLVAVTAVALFALASTDYRRTQYNQQSAQLRQMLMAGATEVLNESEEWPATPNVPAHAIALPDALAHQGASLNLAVGPGSNGKCEAHLTATLENHHATQVLALQRQNEKWKVLSARLEG